MTRRYFAFTFLGAAAIGCSVGVIHPDGWEQPVASALLFLGVFLVALGVRDSAR